MLESEMQLKNFNVSVVNTNKTLFNIVLVYMVIKLNVDKII